jgi:hypothetical protein
MTLAERLKHIFATTKVNNKAVNKVFATIEAALIVAAQNGNLYVKLVPFTTRLTTRERNALHDRLLAEGLFICERGSYVSWERFE